MSSFEIESQTSVSATQQKHMSTPCLRRRKRPLNPQNWIWFLLLIFALSGSNKHCNTQYSKSCDVCLFMPMLFVSANSIDTETDETNQENEQINNRQHGNSNIGQPTSAIPTIRKNTENANLNLRGGLKKSQRGLLSDEQLKVKKEAQQLTLSQILAKAGVRGLGGGLPGAIAGVLQVLSLMWLRTVTNYQCRYGTSFYQAIVTLNNQGGIPRFYRGLSFALVQAPLARFVSTAANDGVETLLSHLKLTEAWGPGRTTIIASIVVGMWRMVLMPIDTCKTVLQVDSAEGFRNLMRKVRAGKISVLYEGAAANALSSIASHYPWFYTYNYLSRNDMVIMAVKSNLLRNASIGFIASIVSDTVTNFIRVVKTTKQAIASKHSASYAEVVSMILAADGWKGLFGRGLRTRVLGNALQSILFTIIWRGLAERWHKNEQ